MFYLLYHTYLHLFKNSASSVENYYNQTRNYIIYVDTVLCITIFRQKKIMVSIYIQLLYSFILLIVFAVPKTLIQLYSLLIDIILLNLIIESHQYLDSGSNLSGQSRSTKKNTVLQTSI